MSTPQSPTPPTEAPPWPHCSHGADPVTDPVGCRGIHVRGHTACLAHLNNADRTSYLAALAPGVDIDHRGTPFTGALLDQLLTALTDPSSQHPHLGEADFAEAQFSGDARFIGAQFFGTAGFVGTQFAADAWFAQVQFSGDTGFGGAEFYGDAWFQARFSGEAHFSGARFSGEAQFGGAEFSGEAQFEGGPTGRRLCDRGSAVVG